MPHNMRYFPSIIMCNKQEPWAYYVGFDLFGYEYNCKYPPNKEQFGNDFGGYATPN